jgi:hypothetical protein
VLVHPSSTKRTAALFRADAVDWFAGVALFLNVLQFAGLGGFAVSTGAFSLSALLSHWAARPLLPLLALPLFAAGLVFKVAIFTAIGKKGVYYGAKFGHTIPWVHGFPFSVTGALPLAPLDVHLLTHPSPAHPQYLGSSLCIAAAGLALLDGGKPAHALLPLFWIALYFLTALAEEGLCHSREPFAPLSEGQRPTEDHESRPVVAAEALRLALLLPLVALKCVLLLLLAACFVLASRAARSADAGARAARLCARCALFVLGFSLHATGQPAPGAVLICNSLSYIDALLLTSAFGPVAAVPDSLGSKSLALLQRLAGVEASAIVVFPEGRRGGGGAVLPFESVESVDEAAMQPVAICYSAGNSFNASWLGGSRLALAFHFYRICAAWLKTAKLAILNPTATSGGAAAAAVASELGWPILRIDGSSVDAASPRGRGRGRAPAPHSKSPVAGRLASASPKAARGRAAREKEASPVLLSPSGRPRRKATMSKVVRD